VAACVKWVGFNVPPEAASIIATYKGIGGENVIYNEENSKFSSTDMKVSTHMIVVVSANNSDKQTKFQKPDVTDVLVCHDDDDLG